MLQGGADDSGWYINYTEWRVNGGMQGVDHSN